MMRGQAPQIFFPEPPLLDRQKTRLYGGSARIKLMRKDNRKYEDGTFEGLRNMFYTIESIQSRAFYTHIHANLNGMSHLTVSYYVDSWEGDGKKCINICSKQ